MCLTLVIFVSSVLQDDRTHPTQVSSRASIRPEFYPCSICGRVQTGSRLDISPERGATLGAAPRLLTHGWPHWSDCCVAQVVVASKIILVSTLVGLLRGPNSLLGHHRPASEPLLPKIYPTDAKALSTCKKQEIIDG